MKPVKAIILAGGELEECFKKTGETAINKAFIKLDEQFMVEFVINALKNSPLIEEIILTVPDTSNVPAIKDGVSIIKSGKNIVETVLNGINYIGNSSEKVLLVMSDIPLLNSEVINDFLLKCDEIEADFYYSTLTKECSEKSYPDVEHTYIKLKDGVFCGGGLILLKPEICDNYRCSLMDKMTNARKNPLEMVRLLGSKILFKIISGLATIKDLEERTSAVFKCRGISIVSSYPEIAVNIDKPKELTLIRSIISNKNKVRR